MFVVAIIGTLVILKAAHKFYFKSRWDRQYGSCIDGCIREVK